MLVNAERKACYAQAVAGVLRNLALARSCGVSTAPDTLNPGTDNAQGASKVA